MFLVAFIKRFSLGFVLLLCHQSHHPSANNLSLSLSLSLSQGGEQISRSSKVCLSHRSAN